MDKTIDMPTTLTGKRNNILETQGHGKVYCFKAEDTFRKEIMLKAHFLMNSQVWQRIRSQWEGNKATNQHKTPQVLPPKRGHKKRAKEDGCWLQLDAGRKKASNLACITPSQQSQHWLSQSQVSVADHDHTEFRMSPTYTQKLSAFFSLVRKGLWHIGNNTMINGKPEAISKSPQRCSALTTSLKILIMSGNPNWRALEEAEGRKRRSLGRGSIHHTKATGLSLPLSTDGLPGTHLPVCTWLLQCEPVSPYKLTPIALDRLERQRHRGETYLQSCEQKEGIQYSIQVLKSILALPNTASSRWTHGWPGINTLSTSQHHR